MPPRFLALVVGVVLAIAVAPAAAQTSPSRRHPPRVEIGAHYLILIGGGTDAAPGAGLTASINVRDRIGIDLFYDRVKSEGVTLSVFGATAKFVVAKSGSGQVRGFVGGGLATWERGRAELNGVIGGGGLDVRLGAHAALRAQEQLIFLTSHHGITFRTSLGVVIPLGRY